MPITSGGYALWCRIPAVVRAPVAAFVVLATGSALASLPLLGNLHFLPQIPWALPATLAVLAAFWWFFAGSGAPELSRAARRHAARRGPLPGSIWIAALPVIVSALLTMISLRLLLPSVLPVAAPSVSIDLGPYPLPTVIGLLLSIALIAAVTEEVAFRGYLQRPLEEAWGIVPAILLAGVAFWIAHSDKVTVTHLPFHLAASVLMGLLAWLTRSLLPCMLAHFAGDAILQPAYLLRAPDFVWTALSARPVWESAGAQTFAQKLTAVGAALQPLQVLQPGPNRMLAALGLVLCASSLLSAYFLVRLARAAGVPPR